MTVTYAQLIELLDRSEFARASDKAKDGLFIRFGEAQQSRVEQTLFYDTVGPAQINLDVDREGTVIGIEII